MGSGSTFIAGDLSGRFVIGLESRKEFTETAGKVFLDLIAEKEIIAAKPLLPFGLKAKKDRLRSVLNFDSDETEAEKEANVDVSDEDEQVPGNAGNKTESESSE